MRDLFELFSPATKRRVRWAVVGSVFGGLAEMVGLAVILPLAQLFGGATTRNGLLHRVAGWFGYPSDGKLATILAAIVFVAYVSKGVFNLIFRWWILGFINRESAATSTDLLRRYMAAPYALHLQRNSAELMRTMSQSVAQAYTSVGVGMLSIVTEVVTMLAIFVVLMVITPVTTIAAVLYFGIIAVLFSRIVRSKATKAGIVLNETTFRTFRSSLQALGGVKEIKVRRNAGHFIESYDDAIREQAEASRMVSYLGEAPKYVLEIVFIVGVALLTVLAYQGNDTQGAVAQLGLFVVAGFRVMPSIVRSLASVSIVRSGRPGLNLVRADLAALDAAESRLPIGELPPPLPLVEQLRLEQLSFRYPSSEVDVLHDVTIDVSAGRSVAIVGPSGAGKSTLVDILLGLHVPSAGRVVSDGVDVATALPRWQRAIGVVPQEVYLLDDSLRANIAFGEPDELIDEKRIAEAVHLAQLDELVAEMPEGLDTFVGERGVRLSGGQRQRIGIARALYIQPHLLVLDEATSALDNETERKITSTIESLHGRLTIVVVAHRLSTVRGCDQLVFLENGEVSAQGTFDQVRATNEAFAALVELANLDRVHGAVEPILDPVTGVAI